MLDAHYLDQRAREARKMKVEDMKRKIMHDAEILSKRAHIEVFRAWMEGDYRRMAEVAGFYRDIAIMIIDYNHDLALVLEGYVLLLELCAEAMREDKHAVAYWLKERVLPITDWS